jgi:phosphoglycolate phosphatase
MSRKTTLITDFDNTLYDWFQMWHQSFTAMLREIVRISGIPEERLLPEIRAIHQQYGTAEYAFLVGKMPSLLTQYPGENLSLIFDDAIHAYRSARKANLALYDGVRETLVELRAAGTMIVVYTDSRAFYTIDRILRLGLDDLVDFVFSPPDHEIPNSVTKHTDRDKYQLRHAQHRNLPDGVIKPNPDVLLDILDVIGRNAEESVYVGDSLMRDVAMAQDAGVADVYAEYGVVQNHPGYQLLREVSHWTDADVEREKAISKRDVIPTHTINNFSEIKNLFGR